MFHLGFDKFVVWIPMAPMIQITEWSEWKLRKKNQESSQMSDDLVYFINLMLCVCRSNNIYHWTIVHSVFYSRWKTQNWLFVLSLCALLFWTENETCRLRAVVSRQDIEWIANLMIDTHSTSHFSTSDYLSFSHSLPRTRGFLSLSLSCIFKYRTSLGNSNCFLVLSHSMMQSLIESTGREKWSSV